MFGMGGTEILVILVVALLFLGPDKLPEAAKTISKGIRDLRKQTRELQNTIESDTDIGGAIRDIKSALRGDEPPRPRPKPAPAPAIDSADAIALAAAPAAPAPTPDAPAPTPTATIEAGAVGAASPPADDPGPTLPPRAGESDAVADEADAPAPADDGLRGLIRPAPGSVAKAVAASSGSGRSDT